MQHYTEWATDVYGNALSGVSISVYDAGTSDLSTVYTDNGITPGSNPLTSGTDGSYDFYAANGRYDLVLTKTGYTFTSADTAGIALYDPTFTTWTPSLGGNATYTVQSGRYTKIGRLVHVVGNLTIASIGSGSANTISGLPYAAEAYDQVVSIGYNSVLASSAVSLHAIIPASTSTIIVYGRSSADVSMQGVAVFGNSTVLGFSASYFTTE